MSIEIGEYIFYADESGDHSLTSVDPVFPVFVMSICAFRISDYCRTIVPEFQLLKFRHFGHDMVILHERDIRKQSGDFTHLVDLARREHFMNDLHGVIAAAPFHVFSAVIDKNRLRQSAAHANPYAIALRACMQDIHRFLLEKGATGKTGHFVFEKRGKREDADLAREFATITGPENRNGLQPDMFRIRFADKRSNSTGLQLADLTARPVGLDYLRPGQHNRAYTVIKEKIAAHRVLAAVDG